jgi:GNAT superfamily N-acetyltransferase
MTFTIRVANIADAPRLAPLVQALSLHERDPTGFLSESGLAGVLAEGALEAVVVEAGGAAIGYCLHHFGYESTYTAKGLYIVDLFVAEAHRRQGVGRALVGEVARQAKARGGVFVWWTSKPGNAEAQAVYARLGAFTEPVLAHAVFDASFEALVAEGEDRLSCD